jgi:hypothetical protein
MIKPDDKTSSATIIDNALITFVGGLSRDERRDAKFSIRLARWAADSKYQFATHLDDWFLHFAATLKFLGWIPFGDVITEIRHPIFHGAVANAYLSHLVSHESPQQIKITQSAFNALQADDAALSMFSLEGQGGNFQILPVERNARQQLKLTVNNFRLYSRSAVEDFLFFESEETETNLIQHYCRFLLDRTVFEDKRAFLERRIKEISLSEIELKLQ